MNKSFVALALGLSGGDPTTAAVYRLAALRVGGAGLEERFGSLVQTPKPLPYAMRTRAGLRQGDLAGAPAPEQVAARLVTFLEDRPLVVAGAADAAALALFLGSHEALIYPLAELADVILPGLGACDLKTMAASFELPQSLPGDLDAEAELVAAVYRHLTATCRQIDAIVLDEVVRLTAASEWPLRYFFRDILEDPVPLGIIGLEKKSATMETPGGPLTPVAARKHVDPEEMVATLECAVTDKATPDFESRPEQCEMTAAVTRALDEDFHLLVEAGTGTGKSLAYLLPAASFALRNNTRVVVSTNTIGLQEQIAGKDIPALRRLLARCGPADLRGRAGELRAMPLKGRRNYLCAQRLSLLRRSPAQTEAEARFLVRILLWLPRTQTGDRAELRLRPDEEALWTRLSAEGSNCFGTANPFVRSGACQLLQARKRAEGSHLVIVNHALLLADVAAGGRSMPSYDRLIVDEAHNLEEEATDQFGFHAGQGEVASFLDGVLARGRERESGLLIDLRTAMHAAGRQELAFAYLNDCITQVAERVDRARERVPETFGRLRAFVQETAQTNGEYDNRVLLTQATRSQPEWSNVELVWENLRLALLQVEDGLLRLGVALADTGATGAILDWETILGTIAAQKQAGTILRSGMEQIIGHHDSERIAWLSVNRATGAVGLSSAPLIVGDVLDDYLFSRKQSVVLTSATLSAGGSFNYVRERLGLQEAQELALGSPFDYRQAAMLLLPSDIPEPAYPRYQQAVEDSIVNICAASHGRALVLFTSHGALRATYRAVRPRLAAQEIRALAQGIDGTPAELLTALRAEGKTVILGTSSFWEGVDVVGEALSALVIAKLPFSVPSDPVFTARSELFEQPFRDYALPQAILRFKQGFGRLIRHRGDCGVVAVLDRRLRSKSYGRTFLRSLPDCTVKEVPMRELGPSVSDWLSR